MFMHTIILPKGRNNDKVSTKFCINLFTLTDVMKMFSIFPYM